jgi:DNA (cytosine-5)-methyltransferase 1
LIKNESQQLKVVSLFCGVGGMDLGALGGFRFLGQSYKKLPTTIALATDFDPKALEIYNSNFSHGAMLADIRDLGLGSIPKHEILTGGFPCQSFSVAATNPPRLGYTDLRGQLFFEMVRVLKSKKPKVFVAENVKGLLSANGRKAFPLVIKAFEEAGYHIHWKILNASDFGVPQKRERVFIVGFRSKSHFLKFKFPEPGSSVRVLSDVLETAVDESFFFSERAVKGMKSSKTSVIMNKGRAQSPDEPCNTVGAHLAKVSLNSTDPVYLENGRYRMFSPREVARIQSFPETFSLVGSKSAQYRGLGNAVAPVMMWHVMRAILRAIS